MESLNLKRVLWKFGSDAYTVVFVAKKVGSGSCTDYNIERGEGQWIWWAFIN